MHNQPNTQLRQNLIMYLIGLLILLGMVQCGCNQPLRLNENLELTTNKTCLHAPEKEFEVIIKPLEGSFWPSLTGWKLRVQFLTQETFGKDAQASHLAHKHAADKQHFTTNFITPLTEYATTTEPASDSEEEEPSELRIPIVLQPSNQATKLRVGIELIDAQNNTLKSSEVSWVKDELLISDLTAVDAQEGFANLTLKNTKDIPVHTSNITLNLPNQYGETLRFSTTNTAHATLAALWSNHATLDPGVETSPITLQYDKTITGQDLVNVIITISQEGDKIVATKITPWPITKAKRSSTSPAQKGKIENSTNERQTGDQPEASEPPTTLPNLQVEVEKATTTRKKFKLFVGNTGKQVGKELLQYVKLKYSIQGIGDITHAKLTSKRIPDINGASLAELINSGLQAGEVKFLEIGIEPGDANRLIIQLFLEGTQNSSLDILDWCKKEKKKSISQPPDTSNLPGTAAQVQTSNQQLSEPSIKNLTANPQEPILLSQEQAEQAAKAFEIFNEQAAIAHQTYWESGETKLACQILEQTIATLWRNYQNKLQELRIPEEAIQAIMNQAGSVHQEPSTTSNSQGGFIFIKNPPPNKEVKLPTWKQYLVSGGIYPRSFP